MNYLWGIDLGGTKIEAVILGDLDPNNIIIRKRIDTEAQGGYTHILNRIAKLISEVSQETGLSPSIIGLGTPGALDPQTQLLKNSNTTCLNGMPFKRDLESLLELPVIMANDANCFALAEATMGAVPEAHPEAQVVLGVIMGTGVGGGIVINGKLLHGRQGIAGEWGHTFIDESGGPCYCGNSGCVERIIAGPSLQRYYEKISGESRKLKEILTRVDSDPHAKATYDRLITFFGKGLGNVLSILDPDVVVLGGGLGNIEGLYTDGIKSIEKYIFNLRLDTVFLKPKLGDSAGVFGAAALTHTT